MPEPEVLNQLFSNLQTQEARLKSFEWNNTHPLEEPLEIDQRIFEYLFTLPLLERVQFSGPQGRHSIFVIVNNADRLKLCVKDHQTLKSISLKRINSPKFINAILYGVICNPILERLHLERSDLTTCGAALRTAVARNTKLCSLSLRGCELKFGVMTQMLPLIRKHTAIASLDLSQIKIPDAELPLIGDSIGELLTENAQIKSLRFRCMLSPENIKSITIGLGTNTSLSFLEMEVLKDTVTLGPRPAETTMDYLSPSDAKKIYDTVLPFTPPSGNQ